MATIKINSIVEALKKELKIDAPLQARDQYGEMIASLMPYYAFDLAIGDTVSMPWPSVQITAITTDARLFMSDDGVMAGDGTFLPKGWPFNFKVIPGAILQVTGSDINIALLV